MFTHVKRHFALMLALAMVLVCLPATQPVSATADMTSAETILAQMEAMQNSNMERVSDTRPQEQLLQDIKSTGSGQPSSYFNTVENYIYTYGSFIDGVPTLLDVWEGSRNTYYFFLQLYSDGILFEIISTSDTASGNVNDVAFLLQETGDIIPVYYSLYFYSDDQLIDYVETTVSMNRTTFTTASEYSVPGGYLVITADSASYSFNMYLQTLCKFWDAELYHALGFGLKALGFTSYDGLGELPCSHSYDNACDSTCNSCGETRPVSHTYSNACDSTCNSCGETRPVSHSYIDHAAQKPSCEKIGWNAYQTCANCDYSTYTELPATGHNYVDGICSVCQAVKPDGIMGDFTGEGEVTNEDVVYLLWHTLFPNAYPVETGADFTGDGAVTNEDVVYLLWHTLFPDAYPL